MCLCALGKLFARCCRLGSRSAEPVNPTSADDGEGGLRPERLQQGGPSVDPTRGTHPSTMLAVLEKLNHIEAERNELRPLVKKNMELRAELKRKDSFVEEEVRKMRVQLQDIGTSSRDKDITIDKQKEQIQKQAQRLKKAYDTLAKEREFLSGGQDQAVMLRNASTPCIRNVDVNLQKELRPSSSLTHFTQQQQEQASPEQFSEGQHTCTAAPRRSASLPFPQAASRPSPAVEPATPGQMLSSPEGTELTAAALTGLCRSPATPSETPAVKARPLPPRPESALASPTSPFRQDVAQSGGVAEPSSPSLIGRQRNASVDSGSSADSQDSDLSDAATHKETARSCSFGEACTASFEVRPATECSTGSEEDPSQGDGGTRQSDASPTGTASKQSPRVQRVRLSSTNLGSPTVSLEQSAQVSDGTTSRVCSNSLGTLNYRKPDDPFRSRPVTSTIQERMQAFQRGGSQEFDAPVASESSGAKAQPLRRQGPWNPAGTPNAQSVKGEVAREGPTQLGSRMSTSPGEASGSPSSIPSDERRQKMEGRRTKSGLLPAHTEEGFSAASAKAAGFAALPRCDEGDSLRPPNAPRGGRPAADGPRSGEMVRSVEAVSLGVNHASENRSRSASSSSHGSSDSSSTTSVRRTDEAARRPPEGGRQLGRVPAVTSFVDAAKGPEASFGLKMSPRVPPSWDAKRS